MGEVFAIGREVRSEKPFGKKAVSEETKERFAKAVQRLHVQLGHPSVTDMLRLLHHGDAHVAALEAARQLRCSVCDEQKKPAVQRFADTPYVPRPLTRVMVDVKEMPWRKNRGGSYVIKQVFHALDEGSRYHASEPVKNVSTAKLRRAFRDC